MINDDIELVNTQHKLRLLEEHIAESRREEPLTEEDEESIDALESMARQLKEEIVRYRSAKKMRDAV